MYVCMVITYSKSNKEHVYDNTVANVDSLF